MSLTSSALLLILASVWSANGQQGPSAYYGLPLGSIFYSSSATQGEVYVSEPKKVIIVNFQHGGEPGCTSFMVGPPVQGANVSLAPSKDGIILAVQPKYLKRRRRQPRTSGEKSEKIALSDGATVIKLGGSSSSQEKPLPPTPLRPQDSAEGVRSGGIKWNDQGTSEQPTHRPTVPWNNLGAGIRWDDSTAPPKSSNSNGEASKSSDVIRLGGGDGAKQPKAKIRDLPIEYIGGINIPDDEEGKFHPNISAFLNDPFSPDRPSIPINRGPVEPEAPTTAAYTIQFGGKKIVTTTTQEPVKTFRGIPLPPAGPSAPSASAPGTQDTVVVKLGDGASTRNATIGQVDTGNHTECGNGWCAIPDPRKRGQAPLPDVAIASVPASAPPASDQSSNTTMSYFVVEDRKAQFLPPELIKQESAQSGSTNGTGSGDSAVQANLPVISQTREEPSVRYEPPVLPKDGKTYLLPKYNGENIVVQLPDPYEISEFQWFGIYDHCKRARTAFVNVRGVKAPKEVKLDGLRGWQYDVRSGDIFVKNCNTLQLTNFTFSGAGKTEAFIYVGNGVFPHSIVQKARAYIDGTFPDRALKNFNNEDVLVKLPSGWRTFDITWIAVFNPKGNVSYGHVLVPQLVVPACDDPK